MLTLPPQLQVVMMSRITIDLNKCANEDIHDSPSSDHMVVDESGLYQHPHQLSRMRFRDPCGSARRGDLSDSDTVPDTDMAPISQNRKVTDETLRPTSDSGGD